jgi:exopolyphosphatase
MGESFMSISDYLEESGSRINSGKMVTVVIGNEAADLDSMASSVAYAYYLHLSGVNAVPVMNIPRNDFALRTEAVYLFGEASIGMEKLLFLDDIDLEKLSGEDLLEVVLVDHNVPGDVLTPYGKVIREILDHHADEKKYSPETAVDIRPVGSAATLVAERFLRDQKDSIDDAVGLLLLGTILLDTVNLDEGAGRVTPDDLNAAQELIEITGLEQKVLFDKLQSEKFNVSSLGSYDLLRKDYKEWQMGEVKCGIASVLMPALDWIRKDPDLQKTFQNFCDDKKLDVLLVMNAYTDPEFVRNLGVYIPDSDLRGKTIGFLESSDLDLEILDSRFKADSGDIVYYLQGNLGISRKKLQPLLKDFFS